MKANLACVLARSAWEGPVPGETSTQWTTTRRHPCLLLPAAIPFAWPRATLCCDDWLIDLGWFVPIQLIWIQPRTEIFKFLRRPRPIICHEEHAVVHISGGQKENLSAFISIQLEIASKKGVDTHGLIGRSGITQATAWDQESDGRRPGSEETMVRTFGWFFETVRQISATNRIVFLWNLL